MASPITIAWKVSYMQAVDYMVYGDGVPYRVEVQWGADSYFRSIYNGDEDQWQREIVASVGILCTASHEMVKPEVLEAFRAEGSTYRDPVTVVTGYFDHTPGVKTWVRMPEGYTYDPKASHDSFNKHYRCYMHPTDGWICEVKS